MTRTRAGFLCLTALVLLSLSRAAVAQDGGSAAELPLGAPGTDGKRTVEQLAPGVTYTLIERGGRSKDDFYTVDVAFEEGCAAARETAREMQDAGYDPRVEKVAERAPDDPAQGPLGFLVRVGRFDGVAGAEDLASRLAEDGYGETEIVFTGEDGGETTGPWVVHVLEVDPDRYEGTLAPALATRAVPGRGLLTSISERAGSLAAVNGGYFVLEKVSGTPGDPAGISVLDGDLVSEAVDGRTSLVLPEGNGAGADVAALSDAVVASAPGSATREVDGVNRRPGLIRGCGGTGGDEPTGEPKHDFDCEDPSELILFTPDFGEDVPSGAGAEAALDPSGRVTELRGERGGPVPPGGTVLSGTGEAADWLRAHAKPGTSLTTDAEVSADGEPLTGEVGVVNGGPRLLADGEPEITAASEGFVWSDDAEFYYRFGARRNPRTLAGTTPGGNLLLVAVDGRKPGYSVGATFEEGAGIMRSLGAEEAVNLDGGGSTGMTIGRELVTRPADPEGERPLADAMILTP